jgi:hypothetical protein
MSYRPILGMMTLFFIVYCLLLGIGTYLLAQRSQDAEVRFKAVRTMALNHLVSPGDLAAADGGAGKQAATKDIAKLEGQYAQLPIRAGQMLRRDDFAAAPLLVPPPNLIAIGLPATGGATANAGTIYRVCKAKPDGKSEEQLVEFEAGALLCTDKARSACTAIAYLKSADAKKLVAAMPEAGLLAAKPTACLAPRSTLPDRTTRPER